MKYALLAVSLLILTTLACSRSVDATPVPTELPTEGVQIANFATSVPTATPHQHTCVEVAAGGYLHLRGDPNESARVIDWLQDGEILNVVFIKDGWMLIEHDGVLGYVRQSYTKEAKCK